MSMKELMAAGNSLSLGEPDPEGVSFDGTNDYLSRTSDLTGNTDSKTFTFSAFVFCPRVSGSMVSPRPLSNGSGRFNIYGSSGSGSAHSFTLRGSNTSGTIILNATTSAKLVGDNWVHLLVSIDMANSSNRKVYINDEEDTGVVWTTYTNQNIDFTDTVWRVNTTGGQKARLAHVFLDYTYRDLSTESNRRLFIDSDGKPSSTIPSSPILYLPMTDAATAGSNSGTGGDFTVNGVLDTAQRGANQRNCVASEFDGSADYLDISSLGVSDTKLFTLSFDITLPASGSSYYITGYPDKWTVYTDSTGELSIVMDSGAVMYYRSVTTYGLGSKISVNISFDLSDTGKRHVYINGVLEAGNYVVYNNLNYALSGIPIRVGKGEVTYVDGVIGEVWFNNTYTDLSTDNPFWDADNNLPKPVAQVIEETGTTPLIALPIRGDDAGNNLGSGGDFTVYSGPFTGARGGSEYWARSAKFGASSNTNHRLSLNLNTTATSFTLVFSYNTVSGNNVLSSIVEAWSSTPQEYGIRTSTTTNGNCTVKVINDSGTVMANIVNTGDDNPNKYTTILVSFKASDTMDVYDTSDLSLDSTSTGSGTIELDTIYIGSETISTAVNTYVGHVYFDTSYIDFSQESSRNLFVDQLGYPKDLTPAIDAGDIAEPLVHMKFDDTSDLGKNSGTGGDFTHNNIITAGADVDPNA
jgi:hypothetical protein